MSAIKQNEIDALRRDRGRLEEVLTQAGAVFKGKQCRCLFHADANASAGIFERKKDGVWVYGCRVPTCGVGGDILDMVQRLDGCDFLAAAATLGLIELKKDPNGSPQSNGHAKPRAQRPPLPAVERSAPVSSGDPPKSSTRDYTRMDYEHLRATRGIDEATARRFGIGMSGSPGSRYWTMPVADLVIKGHRADGQEQKSWWYPKGVSSAHAWPISLDGPGPVWLCPGELKALAVIACGLPAIGITCGEGAELPPAALELVRGKSVALPPDDDAPGMAWGGRAAKQLAGVAAEIRIVKLTDKAAGRKDIADLIVTLRRDGKAPGEIAATLRDCFDKAPVLADDTPPAPDKWAGTGIGDLWRSGEAWRKATYVRTGLSHLDARTCGGLRTRGVHAFMGKTGSAKSQTAVQIASNAARAGTPTGFFSLELGKDEIAQLVAAQLSGVPRLKLATGDLDTQSGSNLQAAMTAHGAMPLTILDDEHWPQGLTRDLLAMLVADGVQRFAWKLIVIDYLNLIVPDESDRDQFTTDLRNSTALKSLARKHDIAVLVVCAVRKGANKKESATVTLDDLLGAGRLAYDATNVFYVSRGGGDRDCGIVFVHPFKMRFAPLGDSTINLRWRPSTGAITDGPETDAGNDYDAAEEARQRDEILADDDDGNGNVPF